MKILGIDPGTRNCGYAIVEKNGRDIKLIEAGLIKKYSDILIQCSIWATQPKIIDEHGLRKLTAREYARMQGFPDTYEQIVSDSQFYKIMGNAVSVNVASHVASMIKEFLLKVEEDNEWLV